MRAIFSPRVKVLSCSTPASPNRFPLWAKSTAAAHSPRLAIHAAIKSTAIGRNSAGNWSNYHWPLTKLILHMKTYGGGIIVSVCSSSSFCLISCWYWIGYLSFQHILGLQPAHLILKLQQWKGYIFVAISHPKLFFLFWISWLDVRSLLLLKVSCVAIKVCQWWLHPGLVP